MFHPIKILVALLMFAPLCAYASWAKLYTEELLETTDLVVVGKLTKVEERTEKKGGRSVDHGQGVIVLSEVLHGSGKAKSLTLVWSNPSGLVCPRVSWNASEKEYIWLLNLNKDGTVSANYPGRKLPLEKKEHVVKLLKRKAS